MVTYGSKVETAAKIRKTDITATDANIGDF